MRWSRLLFLVRVAKGSDVSGGFGIGPCEWFLVWVLVFRLLDLGSWIWALGFGLLDLGSWISVPGLGLLDLGSWT